MALGCSAFARHYSRNRGCFLFLRLLRCFSSPGSLPCPMHSGRDDPKGPGFPIRKSQDHSSVTSFPGHIAGSNVLHRLSTPRHPPYALGRFITPTGRRRRVGPGGRCPRRRFAMRRTRDADETASGRRLHHETEQRFAFALACISVCLSLRGGIDRHQDHKHHPVSTCQRAEPRSHSGHRCRCYRPPSTGHVVCVPSRADAPFGADR